MKASHYPKLKKLRAIKEHHEILLDGFKHEAIKLAEITRELRMHKIGTADYSSGEIIVLNKEEKTISERIEMLEFQIKTLNQTEGTYDQVSNQLRLLENFINA
jgi:hypothetical protein